MKSNNHTAHIIQVSNLARAALLQLDKLPNLESRTLFVIDHDGRVVGALTDGDIRRGLLAGHEISDPLDKYVNKDFKYVSEADSVNPALIKAYKNKGIQLLPVLTKDMQLVKIVDFTHISTILPLTALIMAGGRGERLRPLTDTVPKPMLRIGDKPIIEINIDRLIKYGVEEIFISIKYLGQQIKDYFGDGTKKGVHIKYIEETESLGTIGALSNLHDCRHGNLLLMNSDVLTTIDFEDFYNDFIESGSEMMAASVPYQVKIPYGILDLTEDGKLKSLIEKPTYSYYSNAGIYLLKTSAKQFVPANIAYNATDLMEDLTKHGYLVKHFPILNYWLDIGKQDDFLKAQNDIKHLQL